MSKSFKSSAPQNTRGNEKRAFYNQKAIEFLDEKAYQKYDPNDEPPAAKNDAIEELDNLISEFVR